MHADLPDVLGRSCEEGLQAHLIQAQNCKDGMEMPVSQSWICKLLHDWKDLLETLQFFFDGTNNLIIFVGFAKLVGLAAKLVQLFLDVFHIDADLQTLT